MITFTDDQVRQIREALVYAGRLAHEEILQRGEADEHDYEIKASEAAQMLGTALDAVDSAILSRQS